MEDEQTHEQGPIWTTTSFRETEQACLALIETEIEIAFSFLRLAEVGNDEHAMELIAKTVAIYNVVLQYIQNMQAGFEVEKRKLCREARRLFEAARVTERRLTSRGVRP